METSQEILQRAKKHFAEQVNGTPEVVECEEWGTEEEPLRIYVWPMNLAQRDAIHEQTAKKSLASLVETLVQVARYEDGRQIFTKAQKTELMRSVDPDVIADIVQKIYDALAQRKVVDPKNS